MTKTIKYHWTGEYRLPIAGEWFLKYNHSAPFFCHNHRIKESHWILRREEIEMEVSDD